MEYNYHKNAGQLAFIKFVKGLVHLLIRPKVEWKDKSLKKSLKGKPVVFVCNHTHHFDGVVISSVLSRYKPYMLVKKSWYDKSGTGSFIRICRSIPVDFDTMDTNWYAQSEGAVENGYSMLIFPEGGIAREGKMLPFKPGAAGTMSIGYACDLIREGKGDVFIAGGSDSFSSLAFSGFHALHALDENACSPFNHSTGITLGEGSGILVIESYEHAVEQGI